MTNYAEFTFVAEHTTFSAPSSASPPSPSKEHTMPAHRTTSFHSHAIGAVVAAIIAMSITPSVTTTFFAFVVAG